MYSDSNMNSPQSFGDDHRSREQSIGKRDEPFMKDTQKATNQEHSSLLKSEEDDVEKLMDWKKVGESLRSVKRSDSLESKLLQIPGRSSPPLIETKSGSWAFNLRWSLALGAASIVALCGIGVSVWWMNTNGSATQANRTDRSSRNGDQKNSIADSQSETEQSNQNALATDDSATEIEKARTELAEIALQIEIAEQVLAQLESKEGHPLKRYRLEEYQSVPGRYQVPSRRKRVSTRESLAAALVLSANYEVDRRAFSAANHPNYEYVVQLFPDSRWSSIASERMSSPD